jgi:uncharacterized membrane protein
MENQSLVNWTKIIYALHAVSVLIGVLGSASIIGSFLFGIPSIVAVIMNYIKQSEAKGTSLESHFRWQIRTFWIALAAAVGVTLLFGPFALILIGIPFLLLGYFITGVWVAYRVVRGWLALQEGKVLPNSGAALP